MTVLSWYRVALVVWYRSMVFWYRWQLLDMDNPWAGGVGSGGVASGEGLARSPSQGGTRNRRASDQPNSTAETKSSH